MGTNTTPCGGDAKQTETATPVAAQKESAKVCERRYNTTQQGCNGTAKGNVTRSVLQKASKEVQLPHRNRSYQEQQQ